MSSSLDSVLSSSPASPDAPAQPAPQYFWLWIVCLLGLDYFSTLAYQPSVTYAVVGRLGPLATALVVLITLGGVLPVYCYLAGRSPGGQGSLGMLEKIVRGWRGKMLLLLLLGFAATDFVMLKTLSLADAAEHLRANQPPPGRNVFRTGADWLSQSAKDLLPAHWADYFSEQMIITLFLVAIGFVFWSILRRGFNRNVIIVAVPLVGLYLLLNGWVIGAGLYYLREHPDIVHNWLAQVGSGQWGMTSAAEHYGWAGALLLCVILLPQVALGLSGFEMSMILMPQIRGGASDDPLHLPKRIRNTRKVLVTAALIMSVYLLGSSLVCGLLIPEAAWANNGSAHLRSLAYLAHGGQLADGSPGLPGCDPWLGMIYDIVTVLILCLTGTSVMTALNVLLPQFLLRFGMQMRWFQRWGLLLIAFAGLNFLVTFWFRASVDQQRGAYTTSVLVLMTCAALVVAQERRQRHGRSPYFTLIAVVLMVTTLAVAVVSIKGIFIAALFIAAILALSIFSRAMRVDELRTLSFKFKDPLSAHLWEILKLADFPVLVPHRPGKHERDLKEAKIRSEHQLTPEADIVFLELHIDDPSDFYQHLLIEVVREDHRYVILATGCVSEAQAIAAVALEMSRCSKPPGLHFGWTEMDLLTASWTYLAFGQGNIPWKVHELLKRAVPDAERRPRVIVG